MKIMQRMVVSDGISDGEADLRHCTKCGGKAFFTPQTVMVYSKGGVRSMRLWTCENHRLTGTITDEE